MSNANSLPSSHGTPFTPPPVITTSAEEFTDPSDLISHISTTLDTGQKDQVLVFTGVSPSWGVNVVDSLNESHESNAIRQHFTPSTSTLRLQALPTPVHDAHQHWVVEHLLEWLSTGHLLRPETKLLQISVGTTLEFTSGPYLHATKQPDFAMYVINQTLPTLAIQSGWSQSRPLLERDLNTLLVGGNGHIRLVLLLNWTKQGIDQVRGTVELWGLDRAGMLAFRQRETIFPHPPSNSDIVFTRRELFGPSLLPGRNGNDRLRLSMDVLRGLAATALGEMNLRPA